MEKKICFKCNIEKSLNDYYVHSEMSDGHLNKCKDCTKKDTQQRLNVLKNNITWVESEKKRHREKYYRLGYKDIHKPSKEAKKEIMNRYYEKYPEKKKARSMVAYFTKKTGYHLHHWSYNKEHLKDVIELSIKEHNIAHRFMIYDQERMMYRTLQGELLDTKERHESYIYQKIAIS